MIQDETFRLIRNAIGLEYTSATTEDAETRRGRYYNTLHEGYAILLEEQEEANEAYIPIAENDNTLFYCIRNNNTDSIKEILEEKIEICQNAMAELAQVAAVCRKLRDTIEEYYEPK